MFDLSQINFVCNFFLIFYHFLVCENILYNYKGQFYMKTNKQIAKYKNSTNGTKVTHADFIDTINSVTLNSSNNNFNKVQKC